MVLMAAGWLGCGGATPPSAEPTASTMVEVEATESADTPVPAPKRRPVAKAPRKDGCRHSLPRGEKTLAAARGRGDEASHLYGRALTAIDEGDLDRGRQVLLELVENHKDSDLVPYAYFQFAELYFDLASRDPNQWPVALNFYREVEKYVFPGRPYARLRAAEVSEASGEIEDALMFYTQTARELRGWSDPCHDMLLYTVERGLDRTYAQVGDPAKRCDFFRHLLPHRPCP
jgi:predicted Zn-dependent protease